MSSVAELLLKLGDWASKVDSRLPLGFIDLADWPAQIAPTSLPAFPLIGLGDRSHPLAAMLDAVVEPPVSVDALIGSVSRAPNAASVAVHLLRNIDGLAIERALPIESLSYGLLQGSSEHAAWLLHRTAPDAQPPGRVQLDRRGSTLHATLDRPGARNAIDRVMRDELFEAFTIAALDPEVLHIQLRALGPAFSIGGDLAEFGTTRDPAEAHLIRSQTLPALPFFRCAHLAEVFVQGACIGAGIELAAFARRVAAAPSAWFQLPELAMGLIPGAGGCVSLPRRIGRQRTALMILSGKRIGAKTALEWGLIDSIEDDAAVDDGGPDEV